MTSTMPHVMSAPAAAEAAGITYRQLRYWERQGWIEASQVEEVSANRRVRRYKAADVVRLAALRHLARSGFDVAAYGPQVGQLDLLAGQLLVAGDEPNQLEVIAADELAATVTAHGRWSVFDPTPVLAQFTARDDVVSPVVSLTEERRSA